MKHVTLSVYDEKAQFFSPPMCFKTVAEGTRVFLDECRNSNSVLSQHPEDFSLYEIGSFDDSNGEIISFVPNKFIARGQHNVEVSDTSV